MRHSLSLLIVLAALPPAAGAVVHEVGAGRAYPTIGSVRWSSLAAGDVVRIHPGTYHEKLDLTIRGTAEKPIVVEDVADQGGRLPVIDGTNATTGPHFAPYRKWMYGPGLGLVYIGLPYHVHNVYVEAAGVVCEHNWFGPPRAGALGRNVKDRSSGVVFRYNWVHNGAHLLDLVECQEGCGTILDGTTYRETFVYGNVFLNTQEAPDGGAGGAVRLFHYGAEYNSPRAGTLYFYSNTVVARYDRKRSHRMVMLDAGGPAALPLLEGRQPRVEDLEREPRLRTKPRFAGLGDALPRTDRGDGLGAREPDRNPGERRRLRVAPR